MTPATKPEPVPNPNIPPDPYPDYAPVYGWVFQSWLIMFLAVVCISLVIYLLSFIPR